jgi:hypothetical protein
VSTTEHNAKKPSAETGLLAVLTSVLRGRGRGASASVSCDGGGGRRVWPSVVVGCLLVVLGLLTAAPALAAEPPEFGAGIEAKGVHSTRANLYVDDVLPPKGEKTFISEKRIEYATSEAGPFIVVASQSNHEKGLTGALGPAPLRHLVPETTYYVRLFAETENGGSLTEKIQFTTPSPSAPEFVQEEHGGGSEQLEPGKENRIDKADVTASFRSTQIDANGAETTYRFEYATAEAGPYSPFPSGGTGNVTAAEEIARPEASLTGLVPGATYYIRVVVENAHGHVSQTIPYTAPSDGPTAYAEFSSVNSTSALLSGRFKADGFGAQWRLEYAAGEGGPWSTAEEGTFSEAEVEAAEAKAAQVSISPVEVSGLSPATTYYVRLFVDNGHGSNTEVVHFKTTEPPGVATFATYALEGEAIRVLGEVKAGFVNQRRGEHEAHAHLEYVSQRQFEATGWAGAVTTSEITLEEPIEGSSSAKLAEVGEVVSEALQGVKAGETYHYRFVASNTTVGDPVVDGSEQMLTVPVPAPGEAQAPCPNEAFRVGPSARLPDCRAYEQVTPQEKGASEDAFDYTAGGTAGYLVGADGEHVFLDAPGVKWGSSLDPVQGDYFFSRTPSGWQMTSAKPVGEPGPDSLETEVFNSDLTQFGLSEGWATGLGTESPDVEFKVGPPGGPYQLVASVPSSKKAELVGESADGSKYVLASEDRTLAGHATGTTSGMDLYEFSEGKLRQLNVLGGSPGTPISTCGAAMARYIESGSAGGAGSGGRGTSDWYAENAVSADGSRIFFTDNCTHHLYMRVNGAETVDIGAYELLAANAQGTALALRDGAGEVVGYDAEARKIVAPSSAQQANESELAALGIPIRRTPEAGDPFAHSRDSYFVGNVTGLPHRPVADEQVYRYDSVERVVECVSCASSFDPNPRFRAFFNGSENLSDNNGNIENTAGNDDEGEAANIPFNSLGGSANGDFVFFDTVSALVPQDVDGERAPESNYQGNIELLSEEFSPSSDVYEWRKNGVDGCTRVEGCVSLITTGKGGVLNEFLGTDASGRDVFFATNESLVPGDQDTASDIYDARIGGGFAAPPPRPAECEGDSCSAPAAAPSDLTPASATFQGAGDLPGAMPEAKPTQKQKKKTKRKRKKRARAKSGGRKAGRSTHATRAVHRVHGGVR